MKLIWKFDSVCKAVAHMLISTLTNEGWVDGICWTPTLFRTFFDAQVIAELKKKRVGEREKEHSLFFIIKHKFNLMYKIHLWW